MPLIIYGAFQLDYIEREEIKGQELQHEINTSRNKNERELDRQFHRQRRIDPRDLI